jgi:serine/threonine-protein kinase
MASVYKAADLENKEAAVAIKVVHPWISEDPVSIERFLHEQQIAVALSHKNLVEVIDFGQLDKATPFLVMEYIEGKTLAELLDAQEGSTLPLVEVVKILYQMCVALDYAHESGVVHRDLKPENVMILPDGSIKIADFGIAKADYIHKKLTVTGEMIGTPCYMAPEFMENPIVDHRADIYGLGIMAFELAAGNPPFDHFNPLAITAMHLKTPLPDLSERCDYPSWYRDFVEICAAKKPAHRFQSAADTGKFLQKYLQKLDPGYPLNSWSKKRKSRPSLIARILGR